MAKLVLLASVIEGVVVVIVVEGGKLFSSILAKNWV